MAASSLPIPEAPRTPSPLDNDFHEDEGPKGLGLEGGPSITTDYDYDIQQGISDSPGKGADSSRTTDSTSAWLSPTFSSTTTSTGGLSPHGSLYTPITPQTASTTDGAFPTQSLEPTTAAGQRNPFNFTTTQYVAGGSNHLGRKASNDTLVGKRRGHKYKHSSIHASAMDSIIQPPVMRTPLSVPSSLPIPTRKEAYRSLTSNQTLRLAWCACHFSVAAFVQFSAAGSLAMTALSRLLLFDAAGATVCVIVDVMGNFEVWKRSSIKHPFGLERADVLAGFGMAVFIAFMGLDILSHGIEHSLENLGSHEPHTSHAHSRVATGSVDIASLLAIISTLVSAILLKNHKRIGKATNFALIAGWGKILGNPSHVLTLSGSVLLLVLPLLSIKTYTLFDLLFSVLIASMMITLGVRLGTRLASMLLMSYKPTSPASSSNSKKDAAPNDTSIRSIISSIAADPSISTVEEAKFWQVHYGLCMANLKLRYLGSGEDIGRIRQRVTSLIRQRLGGKWEVSLQMAVDSQ
ncbi:cation diffusion zinc membrane transporter Zrg17 [Vermiconidia calcicola]|uniref:Cation diffusion zinc membrane transporter Zrg17 n=1 Tax=Vermiconidia calcicola TaxID=1690605 RepID=A0ACC3NHZ9_9PEZI|nr:cation diffusion zinc membrane transporter Zrg17 [Vermiconidia calcicola]